MRIGISLLTLAPGDQGAREAYARRLVRELARVGGLEYEVFVPRNAEHASDGLTATEVEVPRVGRRRPLRIRPSASRRARRVDDRISAIDAIHYAVTTPAPPADIPAIVTLHDIQHRSPPDFFGPARRALRLTAYDEAVRSASAVVVASNFVRDRALDVLQLDPTRLHVIPLAIDHEVFAPGAEEPEPFVLYPARPWPHKNHARLFEAFASIRATRPRLRLVLTGGGHERIGPLPEGVESLGVVSTETLASLYRRAACLVYPSLYEGFGLPPLEAMACGCPVAAATAGAIPEVCGDAAVYFDPTDVQSMASAMVEADDRRDALRAKGFARAALYTWETAARRHEEVYRAAASEAPVDMPMTL